VTTVVPRDSRPVAAGVTASASVVADVDAGRPRIRWNQAWPIVLRPTGNARVHLVHGAGGPLGGDVLSLDARIGEGATLAVRSAAATIVQPGRGQASARWDFGVTVGGGARVDWAPEPTVVSGPTRASGEMSHPGAISTGGTAASAPLEGDTAVSTVPCRMSRVARR